MSVDFTRLLGRLDPKPDGESAVRHRTGVVDAVNSDGTVDVDLSGVVVPDVPVLAGASAALGETVQIAAWAGDLLVLGSSRDSPVAGGGWTTWTPSYTSITVNDGIVVARYTQIGKTVHLYWSLDLGPSTVIGSNPTISLPVTSALPANDTTAEDNVIGVGNLTNSGTASYFATVRLTSATTMRPRHQTVSGSLLPYGSIGASSPFTWTTNDRMAISATYEAV